MLAVVALSQNAFVPLSATVVILANGANGILVWEDWRVVASWLGYATVFDIEERQNYKLLFRMNYKGIKERWRKFPTNRNCFRGNQKETKTHLSRKTTWPTNAFLKS